MGPCAPYDFFCLLDSAHHSCTERAANKPSSSAIARGKLSVVQTVVHQLTMPSSEWRALCFGHCWARQMPIVNSYSANSRRTAMNALTHLLQFVYE